MANSVIDDEEPVKAGYLFKLSNSGLVKRYIKWWFEIADNQLSMELVWHTHEGADAKGRLNLEEVVGIRRNSATKAKTSIFSAKGPPMDMRFELICNDKTIEMAALTNKEKNSWLKALSSACDVVLEEEGDDLHSFAKVGNLMKLSGGGKRSKNWSQRYFTLRCTEPDPALSYYANEGDQTPKGSVLLADVLELRAWSASDGTSTPPVALRFEVVTRIRTYVFAVLESTEEKTSWLEELAKGCSVEVSMEPAAEAEADEIKEESVLCSGWLEKMGGANGGFKNWKSRFFVLTEDKLMYFTDVRRIDLKGEVKLDAIKSILPYSQVRLECGIEITTDDRVLVIAAEKAEDKTRWVDAISAASKVEPEAIKFSTNFKGWLWMKSDKGGNTFKRQFFVIVDEKVKEKRFSLANFKEVPPPPEDGEAAEEAPLPTPEPTPQPSKKVVYRLLVYNDEGCIEQKGGIAFKDISEVVMQEYGALPANASPYLNHRFELETDSPWVLAADSDADRDRWIAELQRVGNFKLNDKRPSKQTWDYESALQTKKKVGGYKERYVRLRFHNFTVYREESSQIIKDTIDLRTMSLETIKARDVGGLFGFRLVAEDGTFADWAATTEKVRDEWMDKVIAAGCKVSASDTFVQERARCTAMLAKGDSLGVVNKNIDFEGWVFIMKTSKGLLANSWKKRYARLQGCKLSWAHFEDSDDIDGIICIDMRFKVKVYTQDTTGDKYWPFVLAPVDETLQEIVFAVAVEDIQESWISNLDSAFLYAKAIAEGHLKVLAESIPAAKLALEGQTEEEEIAHCQGILDKMESDYKSEEARLQEESIIKFDTPLPRDPSSLKNAPDKKPKKRTFGKRGVGATSKSKKRMSTASLSASEDERSSSFSDSKKSLGRISNVSDMPDSPAITHKVRKKVEEEVVEVMPTFDAVPEALPAAVYPQMAKPNAEGKEEQEAEKPSEEAKVEEVKEVVLDVCTGEGFVYQGRWKFDWLEITKDDTPSQYPDLNLSQPPEVLAFRTDMGVDGSLVRCY
jgi:hypothetical protein